MALRAYIQSVDFPTDTDTHIVAVVTDDVRKLAVDVVTSSMDQLKDTLRRAMGIFEVSATDGLRSVKANDVIDLSIPDPPPLPGAVFYAAWGPLQSELAKVDAGILAADDKRVVTARAAAQAADDATFLVGRR